MRDYEQQQRDRDREAVLASTPEDSSGSPYSSNNSSDEQEMDELIDEFGRSPPRARRQPQQRGLLNCFT